MLIARAVQPDAVTWFKTDARFDLVLDGQAIGELVYRVRSEATEFTLCGADYHAGRARPRQDDTPLARAIRRVKGQGTTAPNPVLLTDAAPGPGEGGGKPRRRADRNGRTGVLVSTPFRIFAPF